MRLGIFPKGFFAGLQKSRPVWLHAVSVGEVNAIAGLVKKLQQEFSEIRLVISTVTPTGNRLAKSLARDCDLIIYLPLDLSFITERIVKMVNPQLFITTETELWPNLLTSLKKQFIPLALVNGRISPRSFAGYRLFRFLLKDILGGFSLFCMQSELDRRRIITLGAKADKVRVLGNMKFDIDLAATNGNRNGRGPFENLASLLGGNGQLIICGSTHSGEEEIILRIYKDLLLQFDYLRLLIAPRHIERVEQVEKLVAEAGLSVLKVSELASRDLLEKNCVLILDTVGELKRLYDLATIVFIGGSLVRRGGHNIIEPAFFSKAIIVGPHMFNFADITRTFLENQAAIQVHDELELLEEIKLLLLSPAKRDRLGQRAKETIGHNRGATGATFDLLRHIIAK